MPVPYYHKLDEAPIFKLVNENAFRPYWSGYLPGKGFGSRKKVGVMTTWADTEGTYLFLNKVPDNFPKFVHNLQFTLAGLSNERDIRIFWLKNPQDAHNFWQYDYVRVKNVGTTNTPQWSLAQNAFFDIGAYGLSINVGARMHISQFPLSINFDANQVTFTYPGGTARPKKTKLSVPLFGPGLGAFEAYFDMGAQIKKLNLRLRYAPTSTTDNQNPGVTEALDFKVFPLDQGGEGLDLKLSFDPMNPLNLERSYLDLFPYNMSSPGPLVSTFITHLGSSIRLQPVRFADTRKTARFVFNALPTLAYNPKSLPDYYLTPSGNFHMHTNEPYAHQERFKLLCGLSGTELLEFENGDTMAFHPGNPAGMLLLPITDSGSKQYAFSFSNSNEYSTSWLSLIPRQTTSEANRWYYSSAARTPFFRKTTEESSLSFLATSFGKVVNAKEIMYPLVPHKGFLPGFAGFGTQQDQLAAMEFQLLNPTRQKVIGGITRQNTFKLPDGQARTFALTLQGYQATFEKQAWKSIDIAATESQDLFMSFQNMTHNSALQRAFLANQQFFVISSNKGLDSDSLQAKIEMSGWQFGASDGQAFHLPNRTTPGDYSNVLLFKSGNFSIRQLASLPEFWTQYSAFNDTQSDPGGRFLSAWLHEYLEEALELYNGGKGIKSLQNFCELIDDPGWNGLLILKAKVSGMASLPVEMQAIMADIPGTLYAHHIGNEINHVSHINNDYQLKSQFFGLIHYINPHFQGQLKTPPVYVTQSAIYDFTVLSLEVAFEKNEQKHFSNKCMLTINEFFEDRVVPNGANGRPGANNVILTGSYHLIDEVPTFSCTTHKEDAREFCLESNAFAGISITQAEMNASKTETDPEMFELRFSLRGGFRFLENTEFDLLSFEYLAYQGMSLRASIKKGTENQYRMDNSKLSFVKNEIKAIAKSDVAKASLNPTRDGEAEANLVRTGSLVAQFPMRLTGFAQYKGSTTHKSIPSPADLGFRLLQTNTPAGISLQGPEAGKPWYGLVFELVLGGTGALAEGGVISSSLMLVWTPAGSGFVAQASPQFKLAGPGGVSLNFEFQGVLKLGAKDIVLNRHITQKQEGEETEKDSQQQPDYFYLVLQSIGLHLLGLSFPPGGTTNMVLMGDTTIGKGESVKPTLSWFGGYSEDN